MIHESINRDDGRYWDSTGITHSGNLLCDILFPIGSLYFNSSKIDPSTFFGGKWKAVEDVFILTAGSKHKAGSTGGVEKYTLTVSEMPNHKHDIYDSYYGDDKKVPVAAYAASNGKAALFKPKELGLTDDGDCIIKASYVGGNQPHENMPPYKVFYCWERIS